MARITLATLRLENEQLRAQLAATIVESQQWKAECRRAKRDIVRVKHAAPAARHFGVAPDLRTAFFAANPDVRAATAEQIAAWNVQA